MARGLLGEPLFCVIGLGVEERSRDTNRADVASKDGIRFLVLPFERSGLGALA